MIWRHAHRLVGLLVLLATVGSTARLRHACAQPAAEQPAHSEHHSSQPDNEIPVPAGCEMFTPCNPGGLPQFSGHELTPTAFFMGDAVPADRHYLPPVLGEETPPPRA